MLPGLTKNLSWFRFRLLFSCFVLVGFFSLPVRAQTNDAQFISQSAPQTLQPGETTTVSVTMRNTGTTTWDAAADYFLGSQNPENSWT